MTSPDRLLGGLLLLAAIPGGLLLGATWAALIILGESLAIWLLTP